MQEKAQQKLETQSRNTTHDLSGSPGFVGFSRPLHHRKRTLDQRKKVSYLKSHETSSSYEKGDPMNKLEGRYLCVKPQEKSDPLRLMQKLKPRQKSVQVPGVLQTGLSGPPL